MNCVGLDLRGRTSASKNLTWEQIGLDIRRLRAVWDRAQCAPNLHTPRHRVVNNLGYLNKPCPTTAGADLPLFSLKSPFSFVGKTSPVLTSDA